MLPWRCTYRSPGKVNGLCTCSCRGEGLWPNNWMVCWTFRAAAEVEDKIASRIQEVWSFCCSSKAQEQVNEMNWVVLLHFESQEHVSHDPLICRVCYKALEYRESQKFATHVHRHVPCRLWNSTVILVKQTAFYGLDHPAAACNPINRHINALGSFI